MKKIITLLALIFTISINAQTKYDKTITVVVKDFSEACGQGPGDAVFCLTDEKGGEISERYSCNMNSNIWEVEPKDLITKDWTLNTKYKGRKAILYCVKSVGGAGWVVGKAEFNAVENKNQVDQEKLTIPTDNFTSASSRVFEKKSVPGTPGKMEIKLVSIAVSQELYEINTENKKWNEMKIQNGNEICKGGTCVRVIINKESYITVFHLPNTTDGKIIGKIIGDKIIPCNKPQDLAKYKPEDFEKYWQFKFTGDKQKAALMILAYDWFR